MVKLWVRCSNCLWVYHLGEAKIEEEKGSIIYCCPKCGHHNAVLSDLSVEKVLMRLRP